MFPIDRYKFYSAPDGKTIAVSTYAGRIVKGVSRCDSRDTFSQEKGRELAAARCAEKVAKKRAERAHQKFSEALRQAEQANRYLDKMRTYRNDANEEFVNAIKHTNDLLKEM